MATSNIKLTHTFINNTTLLANTSVTDALTEKTLADDIRNYPFIMIIVGNANGAIFNSVTLNNTEFLNHNTNNNLIRLVGDNSDNYALVKRDGDSYTKVDVQTHGTAYVKIVGVR